MYCDRLYVVFPLSEARLRPIFLVLLMMYLGVTGIFLDEVETYHIGVIPIKCVSRHFLYLVGPALLRYFTEFLYVAGVFGGDDGISLIYWDRYICMSPKNICEGNGSLSRCVLL